MMTLVEFARQVEAMRKLQREFFRTRAADRPPDLVGRAKACERAVDRALREVLDGPADLFGSEDRT
jgi:hypothetical protein